MSSDQVGSMDVKQVALWQRRLLLSILGMLCCNAAAPVILFMNAQDAHRAPPGLPQAEPSLGELLLPLILLPFALAALGFTIFCLCKLMGAMRRPIWKIVATCLALPLGIIGLLVLAVVNQNATQALRAAGLKVGLLGAKVA